jgi:signal transduction histidine kinase
MRLRHTLSGRMILLFIVAAILIALTMRSGFRFGIQDELRSLAEPHLLEYIVHLRNEVGNPPNHAAAVELGRRLSLQIHAKGPEQNWSTMGTPPDFADYRVHTHQLADGSLIEVGRSEQGLVVKLTQGSHTILLRPQNLTHSRRIPIVITLTILTSLTILAFTYHLVKRLISPILTLNDGIKRFGSGQLDYRIRINRQDELGELAMSINKMADDIQQMLEAKRQLLLAISHELRSPLTRARINTELLQESDRRQRIIHDLREMETQLTELLETERLEIHHAKLDLTINSPGQLIQEVTAQHFPNDVFLMQIADSEAPIMFDAVRMRLLIKNLLDNALRHTPTGAEPPLISSRVEDLHWLFSVRDQGPGIEPEHLPHLTEAFYRVDKSRQRDTGGYGLGLYLCRVIAEAHEGTLTITSELGKGTEIRVSIPIK